MVSRTIFTHDGLQNAPDDGLRREILGGELYVSPAPEPRHQRAVGELFVALRAYALTNGGEAFVSPIDVVFAQNDATQPDVVYVGPDRISLIGEKYITGAPTLLVEVLSPSSPDVDPGRKLKTYARYGVSEYWIVDPTRRQITAHADPRRERYERVVVSSDESIESLTLPSLRFTFPPGQT